MQLPNRTLAVVVLVGMTVFGLLAALSANMSTDSRPLDPAEEDALAVRDLTQKNQALAPQNGQDLGAQLQIVTLNADEYREPIVALDRLVFEDQPMDDRRRAELEGKLEDLAQRVEAISGSRFLTIEAAELRKLASLLKGITPQDRQNQWMRIRNNLFDDRSWFARSAADLEPLSASPQAEPGIVNTATEPSASTRALPPLTRNDLQGRWRVRDLSGNGRPMADPELSNAVWTFDADQLVIEGSTTPSSRYKFTKLSDDRGDALRLVPNASNAVATERGWMIYEFGERELRLAFYDGLGGRPEGFLPRTGKSDPMLIVLTLERLP